MVPRCFPSTRHLASRALDLSGLVLDTTNFAAAGAESAAAAKGSGPPDDHEDLRAPGSG